MVLTHVSRSSTSVVENESPIFWETNSNGGKNYGDEDPSATNSLTSESQVQSCDSHVPLSEAEERRGNHNVDTLESPIVCLRNLDIEKQSCTEKKEQKTDASKIDDPYDGWNPMGAHGSSLTNLNSVDALSLLTGLTNYRGALCPHADSTGGCYKGSSCPHRYHIDQKKIAENEKLAIPVVNCKVTLYPKLPKPLKHFENEKLAIPVVNCKVTLYPKLPKQTRCVNGMVFMGQVTCVSSPSEFYVVPKGKFHCLSVRDPQTDEDDELEKMTKEMESYFYKNEFRNSVSFVKLELVAVQYIFRARKGFFRAVVIEDAFIEDDEDDANIECYLLDIGITITVDFFSASILPEFFCHLPPLAYKCSLFGVSPLYISYSKYATDMFKELVNTKELCVIIRKSYKPRTVLDGDEEGAPSCIVELLVNITREDAPSFLPVHDILGETRHVKKWNKELWRPMHSKDLKEIQSQLLVSKTKKESEAQTCANNRFAEDEAYKQFLTDVASKIDVKKSKT